MPSVNLTPLSAPGQQHGSTLIEVLIAIFVLAFGVLALMAAQLRSVVSVQESENQTIVATAAQTLMEGMLSNPEVSAGAVAGQSVKTYNHYSIGNLVTACNTATANTYTASAPINKTDLATYQLCNFYQQLNTKLTNATINSATVTANAGVYTINIEWTMQASDDSGNHNSGTVDSSGQMRYTYSLPVQD